VNTLATKNHRDEVLLNTFAVVLIEASTGRIIYANDQMSNMTGLKLDDLMGCYIADILAKDSVFENGQVHIKHRDGTTLPAWVALDRNMKYAPKYIAAALLPAI